MNNKSLFLEIIKDARFDIMLVEICDDSAVLSGIEMIQSSDGSQCMENRIAGISKDQLRCLP